MNKTILRSLFPKRAITIILAVIVLMLVLHSCKTKQHFMTEPLFMQHKRVRLEQPGEKQGDRTLIETVTFSQHLDTVNNAALLGKVVKYDVKAKLDTSAIYALNEVTVASKARFLSERHGKVSIAFLIRVPQEMLSPDWMLSMTPKIKINYHTSSLDEVRIRGSRFYAYQLRNMVEYNNYVNSIVDEEEYSTAFLDEKAVAEDMRRRQVLYKDLYKDDFAKMSQYKQWHYAKTQSNLAFNQVQAAKETALYNQLMSEAKFEKLKNAAMGKDTTGITDKYMARFEKEAKPYRRRRTITEKDVPKEYIKFYKDSLGYENLHSKAVSDKDSVEIAENKLRYDKIAENEVKIATKDLMREKMLPFATDRPARVDTIIDNVNNEFVYLYTEDIPVVAGMRKINVYLTGQIDAIDRSTYNLATTDTLTFFVSTMDQLADTSLIHKRTKIQRTASTQMTLYPEFNGGSKFSVSTGNNRMIIDSLVNTYRSYRRKGFVVDSIRLAVSTDLQGSSEKNRELTDKRAQALGEHLRNELKFSPEVLQAEGTGEDIDGLIQLVANSNSLQTPGEIAQALKNSIIADETDELLRKHYPKDYAIMKKEYFPLLNKVDVSFHFIRPNMQTEETTKIEYQRDYAHAIRLMNTRDYWGALEILSNYNDYNTALCLSLLNYDERAYNLLKELEQTPHVHYLSAILLYRMNRKDEAASALLEALKTDETETLIYRAERDVETKSLLQSYDILIKLSQK